LHVAHVEEIAFPMGYIDINQEWKFAGALCKNGYGQYLLQIIEEKV
jgi:glucose-1-phosphate thymidylyltransferase